MAGSICDYAELKILDHLFGESSFTMPTVYLALYTVAPADAGGGTECPGGNYARVAVAGKFSAAAAGAITNDVQIDMATPNADDWGELVAWALLDNSAGGNFLVWADLTANKSPLTDDPVYFKVGDLDTTLD